MDCLEKITCARKFFLRFAIVSVVFLWVLGWSTIGTLQWQSEVIGKLFNVTPRDYMLCILMFVSVWKLLVIQFTIMPALALWWLEKNLGKRRKNV